MKALILISITMLALGCGSSRVRIQDSPRQGILKHTKIHYVEFHGRPFPYPLARVAVNGTPIWMIVDTGATDHVLGRWLATRLGVEIAEAENGIRDHAGRVVAMGRGDGLELDIDDWGVLQDKSFPVVDLPAIFEELRLGGILSPQRLSTAETPLVLDLKAGEMFLLPNGTVPADFPLNGHHLGHGPVQTCQSSEANAGWKYLLPATLNGSPAVLVVDTGAAMTNVQLQSVAGRTLLEGSLAQSGESYSIGGEMEGARELANTVIAVGDVTKNATVELVSAQSAPHCGAREGVVGMDVLRSCVLLLAGKEFVGSCDGVR